MENASKAFLIAGGTLIGVMLVILITVFFRSLSPLEREKQNEEQAEQITAFNKEYDAYNKKLMYGVDLISVLNKAKSNNEKYVSGNFLSGFKYNNDYLINIEFTIKEDLTDTVLVNYLSTKKVNNGGEIIEITENQEGQYVNDKGAVDTKLTSAFKEPTQDYFSKVNDLSLKKLVTGYYKSKFTKGTYNLLDGENNPQTNDTVNTLLNVADAIKKNVKNPSENIKDKLFSENGWSSAEWRTSLYDLKTRKFKCVDEKYNEQTGRIIYMEFTEI